MEDDPKHHPWDMADNLLYNVHLDTIHRNNGMHMPGGVDPLINAF